MQTAYSDSNQEFSDAAHMAARSLIYPILFNCEPQKIQFKSVSVSDGGANAILDGEMGIDRIMRIHVNGLRQPVEHTIQERFRKPVFAQFRDITVTEWNHSSNLPSELYKIKSSLFVYGYFNPVSLSFGEVVAVDTAKLMLMITRGSIAFNVQHNPRSKQDFVCLTFDVLHDHGLILFHHRADS